MKAWLTESDLENWMMGKLGALGFATASGAEISPEKRDPERRSFHDAVLRKILSKAVARLNPHLPDSAVAEVISRVADDTLSGDLIAENRRVHRLMTTGVPVTYVVGTEERHDRARLVDWSDEDNAWHAFNQVDMVGRVARIPDVVIYLNGLPFVVVELKGTEGADLEAAFNQIETYKADIPALFGSTIFSVISDGVGARYGTLSADFNRFMRWRTVDGETIQPNNEVLALGTLTEGLLNRRTLLDMLRWFVVFEDEGKGAIKKAAGYHQFHAVRKAVESIGAARSDDGKGGVIWHTQGSGKSLLMAFLAGRLMRSPKLENPTIVVLTDRNDLDNQLFATFGRCRELLGEEPVQAESIDELKSLLSRQVGGVVFSTIQKFRPERGQDFPQLTGRTNVIVMVDEAHRTQYGFDAKIDEISGEVRRGLAHHLRCALPKATYVAFTGTPIELVGANTRSVFGDYIDIYDIARAVEDGATVPIYYEGRVARIELDTTAQAVLDEEFDEVTEGFEDNEAGAIARRWSSIEKLVGADTRLDAVVADILRHFDARLEAIDGKAMIVCMSRRICAEVYDRIIAARPDWHSDSDEAGSVKVVMTGNATDPVGFQAHIRSKTRQEALRRRYKDTSDPLRLVIVRDMWLTGFDAPCMHTLYVDKPMRSHGLMQAIARVNRVFSGKPSGLVVDYIGLAAELKNALAHYSKSDQAQTGIDERDAVRAFLTALDVVRSFFHGLDYQAALGASSLARIEMLAKAIDHVLGQCLEDRGEDDKDFGKRFHDVSAALAKAFKLAAGSPEATEYAEEVAFILAIRTALRKMDIGGGHSARRDSDFAIEQLLNRAVTSTEVIDILEACGFDRPDISVLSEEFLIEIQNLKQKNLAVEALKKLLNGEIKAKTGGNVVQNAKFSERLSDAIARYHNRSVDALQVIQELIALANELKAEPDDDLSEAERSFYDALAQNESAVEVMGNEELRIIATELVNSVRESSGVDWWQREDVRAKMRVAVKRILRRYGYPPDLQSDAVKLIIRQAEAMAKTRR